MPAPSLLRPRRAARLRRRRGPARPPQHQKARPSLSARRRERSRQISPRGTQRNAREDHADAPCVGEGRRGATKPGVSSPPSSSLVQTLTVNAARTATRGLQGVVSPFPYFCSLFSFPYFCHGFSFFPLTFRSLLLRHLVTSYVITHSTHAVLLGLGQFRRVTKQILWIARVVTFKPASCSAGSLRHTRKTRSKQNKAKDVPKKRGASRAAPVAHTMLLPRGRLGGATGAAAAASEPRAPPRAPPPPPPLPPPPLFAAKAPARARPAPPGDAAPAAAPPNGGMRGDVGVQAKCFESR